MTASRGDEAPGGAPRPRSYPKIELHVHLEGAIRAPALREMARRNRIPLGDLSPDELQRLYTFVDFPGFIGAWVRCSDAVRTGADMRQLVVDYAEEAASHGAVYVEAIFSPAETVRRGADWDSLFGGATAGSGRPRNAMASSCA